ncbi:MAG TPA: serine/threonine-protein kinase, partial [Planctomycetota bacterium]|nr:serine/threonine-protein kinase [Planctomycetota bacterium]
GKGGMGVVYEGLDETLDRRVALKVLHPQYANNREYQERFLREARNAANATLDHPNITQIYAAGRQGPYLWLAMQLVRGRTLTKLLEERGKLPPPEALKIARQISEGLSAAHAARMIHRDIKPDNLMIDESGRVKIMDFGLMRSVDVKKDALTVDGLFVGTLEYASPEQCKERALDARTDLYSLGVVLYELLSGKRPYHARTPLAYLSLIPDPQQPPMPLQQQNPQVPEAIVALVHRLLSKRPEDRPASAAALVAEIDRIPLASAQGVPAPSIPSPMRAAIVSIAAWSVVLAAGLAAAFWLWPKEGKLPPVPWSAPQHPEPTLGEPPEPAPKGVDRERPPDRTADAGERGTAELSAFDQALPEGQQFELVGPADWGTWEIDRRDAPGASVVLHRSPNGIGMSTPSAKEQVRLLRRLRGAEKGYRIQWTFAKGSSEATAFMVALSVTRWVEVGPRAISLFRVDREGGEEKIVMSGKSALPDPIARGTLHVIPSGDVLLIYLNARLMFSLPAADYPLSEGLQLGVSGGSLTLESIRLRDRSGD